MTVLHISIFLTEFEPVLNIPLRVHEGEIIRCSLRFSVKNNTLWARVCLSVCRVFHRTITTVTFDHIVATMTLDHTATTMACDHTVTMTLDHIVTSTFDNIVAYCYNNDL
jgi:hypothetical protein